MRRMTLTALALILSLAVGLPLWADEAPVPTDLDLSAELAQEPSWTPVDEPLDLGEIDIEKDLRRYKIRICEDEEWATCPDPSCSCYVVRNEVRCNC